MRRLSTFLDLYFILLPLSGGGKAPQEAFKSCSRFVQLPRPGVFNNRPYHLLRARSRHTDARRQRGARL